MSSTQQFSADQYQLPAYIQQSLQLRDTQLCCYPSKRCQNLRVMKRNGELHRLCEYHRMKANVNQRRLEQRRRMRTNGAAAAARSNQVEEFASRRLSLPDLNAADTSDLELDVLDEFLAQADIELSPVSASSHSYVHDFIDSDSDIRMSI
ncbi:hypothetical protein PF010_g1325 [Phytophthora fragariae]|uniref:Uncharacterized protein n=2 Tax=Phytophthora fragariae TaxID=53985 RepID=A0A6A3TBR3_9STRA|nr:hypothetical protein PF003_g15263 [Phytophthora fragariae]KAE8946800.1 hypothetical protein PF009_g3558 [Phytophthora fragariae]KAE9026059.1 hypothetical protein PF011_g2756 [Phytophthora fragariae]KAE9133617.1 hypothetical protein PF007_g3259 [Phytophthora fragariae]KAE9137454.1 hypothetical protein PF010_g1325 [Phytophthora fragariae]